MFVKDYLVGSLEQFLRDVHKQFREANEGKDFFGWIWLPHHRLFDEVHNPRTRGLTSHEIIVQLYDALNKRLEEEGADMRVELRPDQYSSGNIEFKLIDYRKVGKGRGGILDI
jgi:hypothetical protein